MSTIVVGSGTSVLDYEAGDVIDNEFEDVVRFHGFDEAPQEYAENVGTRVTDVCMNTNIKTARTVRSKLKDDVFESFGVDGFYVTWTRKRSLRRALRHVKNPLWNYELCNYEFLTRSLNRYAYANDLDEYDPDQDLSSGLIMVAQKVFEEEAEDVYIHGFDALEYDTVPANNYYEDDRININRLHNLQNEALMLDQMAENGDVTKLSNVL